MGGYVPYGTTPDDTTSYIGSIDEIRVWNFVRTQAQVQADYKKLLVGNETGLVSMSYSLVFSLILSIVSYLSNHLLLAYINFENANGCPSSYLAGYNFVDLTNTYNGTYVKPKLSFNLLLLTHTQLWVHRLYFRHVRRVFSAMDAIPVCPFTDNIFHISCH